MTNSRKEIINQYKDRKIIGGVYTIDNTLNGKYLLGHAANLQSVKNHFQFSLMTGSTLHPKLQKDWQAQGATTFTLTILEEMEQRPEQTHAEFMDDLKILEQLWQAKLDPSKAY